MREPTEVTARRAASVGVLAGPYGYYGRVYDLWIGPQRQEPDEAWADALGAADCIDATELGVLT